MGRVDSRQEASSEISTDALSVYVWNSKRIQSLDGRQKVAVEIQKTLCEDKIGDILVNFTCFFSKNCLKIVKSTWFAMTIVQN